MTKRDIKKTETRKRLVDTAYQVFAERGITASRMSDIAEAAGASHGTVFAHFSSQEALIETVVDDYGQKIALRTHELADTCDNLEELLRAHLNGLAEFEPFYTRLVVENTLLPQGARDAWISIQSAISFHFSRVAEREFSRLKRYGIPSSMAFNMWIGLVHYYLMNGDLFAPEGGVLRRYGETLIESFIALLNG